MKSLEITEALLEADSEIWFFYQEHAKVPRYLNPEFTRYSNFLFQLLARMADLQIEFSTAQQAQNEARTAIDKSLQAFDSSIAAAVSQYQCVALSLANAEINKILSQLMAAVRLSVEAVDKMAHIIPDLATAADPVQSLLQPLESMMKEYSLQEAAFLAEATKFTEPFTADADIQSPPEVIGESAVNSPPPPGDLTTTLRGQADADTGVYPCNITITLEDNSLSDYASESEGRPHEEILDEPNINSSLPGNETGNTLGQSNIQTYFTCATGVEISLAVANTLHIGTPTPPAPLLM